MLVGMMISFLAFTLLASSALLCLGSLRMVAADTMSMVRGCAARARATGSLHQRLAFLALWVLIFGLGYAS